MQDANDFVRAIQQVSNGVNEAGYPADVMSGTVIAYRSGTFNRLHRGH